MFVSDMVVIPDMLGEMVLAQEATVSFVPCAVRASKASRYGRVLLGMAFERVSSCKDS